jgi:tripartite ATP-independent transporter DctP family solute receptor
MTHQGRPAQPEASPIPFGFVLSVVAFMVAAFSSLYYFKVQAGDSVIIRYAHVGVPNEPQTLFVEHLADLVNRRTAGRVEIRNYPNSQLGNASEMIDGVKYGFIGMSQHDFSSLARFTRDVAVFNAPYVFRDVNHAISATNPRYSPVLQEINHKLIENSNIRILGSFYRGTRQLTTSFPVYSIEDLRGKKIRGVPFPIWMSMLRGMGAIPTPVEFSELTTALLTGMVVGQENPLSNIYASKIYEVQSHIIMTNHMHSCMSILINERLWQRIRPSDRGIISEAIVEVSQMAANWILEGDAEIEQQLRAAGLIFIDQSNGLDLESIRTSVLNQITSDYPEWGDLIARIHAVE